MVAPPAVLWLPEAAAHLVAGERGRRTVHLVLLAGLFAVLALEVGKHLTPVRGGRLVLAALVAGALVALVYVRWPVVKLRLRYLAPAPLVFAMLFATTSPSSKLLLPSGSQGRAMVPVRTDPARPLPPVVMVFFDEFPLQVAPRPATGRIDAARSTRTSPGSPAELDLVPERHRRVRAAPRSAVPAMLTGRYPARSGAGRLAYAQVYPDDLFTMFGHGYDLRRVRDRHPAVPAGPLRGTTERPAPGSAPVARQTAQALRAACASATVDRRLQRPAASIGRAPPRARADPEAKPSATAALLGEPRQVIRPQRVDRFVVRGRRPVGSPAGPVLPRTC